MEPAEPDPGDGKTGANKKQVVIALISTAGIIIAALITGIFTLASGSETPRPSPGASAGLPGHGASPASRPSPAMSLVITLPRVSSSGSALPAIPYKQRFVVAGLIPREDEVVVGTIVSGRPGWYFTVLHQASASTWTIDPLYIATCRDSSKVITIAVFALADNIINDRPTWLSLTIPSQRAELLETKVIRTAAGCS